MKTFRSFFVALGLLSIVTLLFPFNSFAQDVTTSDHIAVETAPSVVRVNAYKAVPLYAVNYDTVNGELHVTKERIGTTYKNLWSGSAFFVTPNGYLVTNNHVVQDPEAEYAVLMNGREVSATVVKRDATDDLALIKVSGSGYPAITIRASSSAKVGEDVVAMGNALGRYIDSFSEGEITDIGKNITAHESDNNIERLSGLIQTNARVYPGDSGGPLVDASGHLIGVNVATAIGQRIGFAIPVDTLLGFLTEAGLIRHG